MREDITPEEWAWFAGLFEGEGSITLTSQGPGHPPVYPRLQMSMVDYDIIHRVHVLMGGSVYPKRPSNNAHGRFQLQWHWQVHRRDHVFQIIEGMRPWLGARRGLRADEVLALRTAHQDRTHCAQGHELTPENTGVSKNGRRRCLMCVSQWREAST